ncbi:glutamine synthetase [Alphaproteobacteria bacterium]|nr:glutamine synthetase [Alphaproteobacteria bacterium]
MTKYDLYLDKFSKHKLKITEYSYTHLKDFLRINFFGYNLVIGVELEFYLTPRNHNKINNDGDEKKIVQHIKDDELDKFIDLCNDHFFINKIGLIKREQGINQLEFSSFPYDNILELCEDLDSFKENLSNLANLNGYQISYKAFHSLDDCPNSLQFNLSVLDKNKTNILRSCSLFQELICNNLLDKTNDILIILAPSQLDYLRYNKEINKKLFSLGKYNSPVNLSIGSNNRTCAIRIPTFKNFKDYRIEYRVASSNCNHWLSISALLLSLCSLQIGISKYELIYGNAFDENYDHLTEIIQDIDSARDRFFNMDNNIFRHFLNICNNA